jgi:hypothetical protein
LNPRQGKRIFPVVSVSRQVLGPTQPSVRWVPGVLSPGVKRGRGVTLTTHPHLVPRSRMSRSYTSSLPSASMACSGTAFNYLHIPSLSRYLPTSSRYHSFILLRHTGMRSPHAGSKLDMHPVLLHVLTDHVADKTRQDFRVCS